MQVRKLEFLLAEAIAQGHDCVVTIGGIQSNHCRATAVAARYIYVVKFMPGLLTGRLVHHGCIHTMNGSCK